MAWKKVKVAQSCLTLCDPMDYTDHGILQARVGSCSLLQGIFPTQGLNPGLPHCRQILYQLSHQGSPRLLEWVAYPFSGRSSHPGIERGSILYQLHCRQILHQLNYGLPIYFLDGNFLMNTSFTFDWIHFLIFKNFYAFCVLSKNSLFIKIFFCGFLFSFWGF